MNKTLNHCCTYTCTKNLSESCSRDQDHLNPTIDTESLIKQISEANTRPHNVEWICRNGSLTDISS